MSADKTPQPPIKVFGLRGPASLFRKLHWERNQLQRSLAAENYRYPDPMPLYIAFNCAITAWHLVDWVWSAASPEQQQNLADRFGFTVPADARKGLDLFSDAICAHFHELAGCRDIANGSKHFDLRKPKTTTRVEAGLSLVVSPGMSGLKPGDHLLSLHVWLEHTNMTAQNFFDRILAFWHETLRDIGMFDGAADDVESMERPPLWLLDRISAR